MSYSFFCLTNIFVGFLNSGLTWFKWYHASKYKTKEVHGYLIFIFFSFVLSTNAKWKRSTGENLIHNDMNLKKKDVSGLLTLAHCPTVCVTCNLYLKEFLMMLLLSRQWVGTRDWSMQLLLKVAISLGCFIMLELNIQLWVA